MENKTKRKNRIFWVLLATMLILFGVSFRNDGKIGISGVQSVQAATKNVVVRFWNQSGKTILFQAAYKGKCREKN